MRESTKQISKIDLDYYVIKHQRFRMDYTILSNSQNANLEILHTNTPLGNPFTDY